MNLRGALLLLASLHIGAVTATQPEPRRFLLDTSAANPTRAAAHAKSLASAVPISQDKPLVWDVRWEGIGEVTGIVSSTNLALPMALWRVECCFTITNDPQRFEWRDSDANAPKKFYRAFTAWE